MGGSWRHVSQCNDQEKWHHSAASDPDADRSHMYHLRSRYNGKRPAATLIKKQFIQDASRVTILRAKAKQGGVETLVMSMKLKDKRRFWGAVNECEHPPTVLVCASSVHAIHFVVFMKVSLASCFSCHFCAGNFISRALELMSALTFPFDVTR